MSQEELKSATIPVKKGPGPAPSSAQQAEVIGRDWSAVVERIHDGDPSAESELYQVFSRGIRFSILRQLGEDGLEDNVHDCFLASVKAIRRGQVREPEKLMGFVRTIVQRKIASTIGERVAERSRLCSLDQPSMDHISRTEINPEHLAIERQHATLARAVVARLPEREREILERFYVMEQPKEQICAEMKLTETQFRLVKSRTKAKLLSKTQELRRIATDQAPALDSYRIAV